MQQFLPPSDNILYFLVYSFGNMNNLAFIWFIIICIRFFFVIILLSRTDEFILICISLLGLSWKRRMDKSVKMQTRLSIALLYKEDMRVFSMWMTNDIKETAWRIFYKCWKTYAFECGAFYIYKKRRIQLLFHWSPIG